MLDFLYGFMARDSGGKDVFVQSPRLTDRASALSTRDKLSLSMLLRAERGSKPQGCA
jgi:cold shock CspA family protein